MSSKRRAHRGPADPISGRISIVGPCASGKTVLVNKLCARGYDARQCVQEHSYVGDMWERISRPQALVYLDASLETVRRRGRSDYTPAYFGKQLRRLAHAREHCDVYVQTDDLSEEDVCAMVVRGLDGLGVKPQLECQNRAGVVSEIARPTASE